MKYSSIFSMLSFFILFACNETAVYGSDENIIFMRYVEKLHLDKYSVKNTVKTETMAGNDSNLLIVFYVQIMPDDFVMQLHRF